MLDLTRRMTLGQISAREDFAKRIEAEKPVYLHECLYPLMQGWDSVEIKADVELGGTEQLFSLLVARDLQQEQGQAPQVAITMPILVGTDGHRRMGKSLGNYIGVAEPPDAQFGKVMSIPDEPMRQYFTLLTDLPLAEVDRLLAPGVNPRDAKEVLGKAIVSQYHGPEAADGRRRRVPPPRHRRGPRGDPRGRPRPRPARRRRPDRPCPGCSSPLGLESSTSERPPRHRAGGRHTRPRPHRVDRPEGRRSPWPTA